MKKHFRKKIIALVLLFIALIIIAFTFYAVKKQDKKTDYEALDKEALKSQKTTVAERREYYNEHVDGLIENMDDKEKEDYYVTVKTKQLDQDKNFEYSIWFLRNDNEHIDGITVNDECVKIPPGVYKIIAGIDIGELAVAEMEILSPGEKITLEVDCSKDAASITRGDGEITEVYEDSEYDEYEYYDEDPYYYKAADAPKLDFEKLDESKTSVKEREDYYEKYVSEIMNVMTEEEQEKYCVTINFVSENVEKESDIFENEKTFLRNDGHVMGWAYGESTSLSPGIYELILKEKSWGKFAILAPCAEIMMVLDYETQSIQITEGEGEVLEK